MAKRGRKPIDKAIIERIREMYMNGYSIGDISKELKVSPFFVSKYTRHLNRDIPTNGEIKRLIDASKILNVDEEIVKKIIPKLSKREIVMYALNLIRLKPYLEAIENAKINKYKN